MKKILITTLAAFVVSVTAYSDAISLNWAEFGGAANLIVDPYGVEAASNWQNLVQVASGSDVVLSSGATSTVDFSTTVPAGWGTYFNAALANTPMRAGVESFNSAIGPDITLSDLNGTFATYDVIVYAAGFNAAVTAGNQGAISDGTTTYYYSVPNPYVSTLTQSTDTNIGDGADVATYVRFDGLTADSVTISLRSPNNTGVSIGGLQIVGTVIPEPATMGLFGIFGGAMLYLRRRFEK